MTFIIAFVGFVVVMRLVFGFAWGDFRPCKQCGSRLTHIDEGDSPDASKGRRQMHHYVVRHCRRCKYSDVEFSN